MTSPFSVIQNNQVLRIQPRKVGESFVYVVQFQDGRAPLALTIARGEKKQVFWTSIPEGRQTEAESIGPMITNHYKTLSVVK